MKISLDTKVLAMLPLKFRAFNVVSLLSSDIYELHVHLGQETQYSLSQDLWKKVKNLLNVTLDNEDSELELGKDFHLDWVDGKGLITCINKNTVGIFIEIIQDFKIKGQTFGAYAKSHTTHGQENKNEGIYVIFLLCEINNIMIFSFVKNFFFSLFLVRYYISNYKKSISNFFFQN